MANSIQDFFALNRTLVLFVYGLTFFVMGLGIFLSSRSRSQLKLARHLQWLAAFGILHGVHEWGDIFIPIQDSYLPPPWNMFLRITQVILLATSFICLLIFGTVLIAKHWQWLWVITAGLIIGWVMIFLVLYLQAPIPQDWLIHSNIGARYLLCLPGSILAAYGLYYQAHTTIVPLRAVRVMRNLRLAGVALLLYGALAGVFVRADEFFPANILNRQLIESVIGVPIEVLRSMSGLVLCLAIIRALEIFELELDHRIEAMEIERVQAAERERIGQEIHDGAIQGIYSTSLILESIQGRLENGGELSHRLQQARDVLDAVNRDLRSYMISLRTPITDASLNTELQKLIADPRFQGLLNIELECSEDLPLTPIQVNHLLGIVQEGLANIVRHAQATHAHIRFYREGVWCKLSIEDNGRGFFLQATPAGYGLRSMRDRARLLGGTLDIETTPGSGTRINLGVAGELPDSAYPR